MGVAVRHVAAVAALLLLAMSACRKPSSPLLPEGVVRTEGVVRIDNTDRSGPCRITVLNATAKSHALRLAPTAGKVLLDADVPPANCKPPVWHMFGADVAGQTLTVTLDGATREVVVAKDTVEIVIDTGEPLTAPRAVYQSPQRLGWL